MKLTSVQIEVLEFLRDGGIMSVDRQNIAWCADRPVQFNTRSFLSTNKLISRSDKSRALQSKGNGYAITEKGLSILLQQSTHAIEKSHLEKHSDIGSKRPPTERQLNYARDLGIDVPGDANLEEVSDLISAKVDTDERASDTLLQVADQYKVNHTRFTGKFELLDRIFETLNRPTREVDLLAWFTLQVFKSLSHSEKNLRRPNREDIYQIAAKLVTDDSVLESVRRHRGQDLLHFGEWQAPDGTIHTGASTRTIAYRKVVSSLISCLKQGDD